MNESDLIPILKVRLGKLTYDIVNEDLTPATIAYLRYDSLHGNWLTSPAPVVNVIDTNGVKKFIFPTDYTVDYTYGHIDFNAAKNNTDVVRVNYSFFPFTDAQLLDIIQAARKQIQNLIFRTVDATDIPVNYQELVIKKAYSIAMREMQFPTIKYFSISVGGRSISKEAQVTMIDTLIKGNEEELLKDINTIRYFDKTTILS